MVEKIIDYFKSNLSTYKLVSSKFKVCYFFTLFSIPIITLIVSFLYLKLIKPFPILVAYVILLGIIVIIYNKRVYTVMKREYEDYNIKIKKNCGFVYDSSLDTLKIVILKKWLIEQDIKTKKQCIELVDIIRMRAESKRFDNIPFLTALWGALGVIYAKIINYIYEFYFASGLAQGGLTFFSILLILIVLAIFLEIYLIMDGFGSIIKREYYIFKKLSNLLSSISFDL